MALLFGMKQKIGRIGEVLGWIFVLALVLGPWIAWLIGEPYRHLHVVREGELCGPLSMDLCSTKICWLRFILWAWV